MIDPGEFIRKTKVKFYFSVNYYLTKHGYNALIKVVVSAGIKPQKCRLNTSRNLFLNLIRDQCWFSCSRAEIIESRKSLMHQICLGNR